MPVVVVVGSLNTDLVARAPRHPEPGETILGSGFATFPGGKGANQAVAAARLGATVRMVGRVGDDGFGSAALASLQKDQVDTSHVRVTKGHPSGVALITVSDQGQNTIVVVPGANAQLTPEDVRAAEPAFSGADAVIAQLEIPLEAVYAAGQMARQHGAKFLLNPAPACVLPPELMALVDYLIPNQPELAMLTGLDPSALSVEEMARSIYGNARMIVTLGDKGAQIVETDHAQHIPPHPVNVVDTTAAGDAFVGAFAVALAEGLPLENAARWGNAAGALAVTTAGAQPSLPVRSALEQLLATAN